MIVKADSHLGSKNGTSGLKLAGVDTLLMLLIFAFGIVVACQKSPENMVDFKVRTDGLASGEIARKFAAQDPTFLKKYGPLVYKMDEKNLSEFDLLVADLYNIDVPIGERTRIAIMALDVANELIPLDARSERYTNALRNLRLVAPIYKVAILEKLRAFETSLASSLSAVASQDAKERFVYAERHEKTLNFLSRSLQGLGIEVGKFRELVPEQRAFVERYTTVIAAMSNDIFNLVISSASAVGTSLEQDESKSGVQVNKTLTEVASSALDMGRVLDIGFKQLVIDKGAVIGTLQKWGNEIAAAVKTSGDDIRVVDVPHDVLEINPITGAYDGSNLDNLKFVVAQPPKYGELLLEQNPPQFVARDDFPQFPEQDSYAVKLCHKKYSDFCSTDFIKTFSRPQKPLVVSLSVPSGGLRPSTQAQCQASSDRLSAQMRYSFYSKLPDNTVLTLVANSAENTYVNNGLVSNSEFWCEARVLGPALLLSSATASSKILIPSTVSLPAPSVSAAALSNKVNTAENANGFLVAIKGEKAVEFTVACTLNCDVTGETGSSFGALYKGTLSADAGEGAVRVKARSDGAFTFTTVEKNSSGDTSVVAETSGVADLTPPSAVLTLANDAVGGWLNSGEVTVNAEVVTFDGADSNAQTYSVIGSTEICNDSKVYTAGIPTAADVGSTDGMTRKICVRATDTSGNISFADSPIIRIDKTAPEIVISGPTPADTVNHLGSVSYSVYASDSNQVSSFLSSKIFLSVQSGMVSCPAPQISGSGSPAAPYVVTVNNCTGDGSVNVSVMSDAAKDAAGNSSGSAVSAHALIIDNTAPTSVTVTLVGSASDHKISHAEKAGVAADLVSVSGNGGTVSYSIAANQSACHSANDYSNSVPQSNDPRFIDGGSVVICVKDTDTAGNSTVVASATLQTDTTPPSAPLIEAPSLAGNQMINIIENASGFLVTISGEPLAGFVISCTQNCKVSNGGSFEFSQSGTLSSEATGKASVRVKADGEGEFNFLLTQTDVFTNKSSVTSVTGSADLTAPVASLVLANGAANDGDFASYLSAAEVQQNLAVVSFNGSGSSGRTYAIAEISDDCSTLPQESFSFSAAPRAGDVGTTNGVTKEICVRATDDAGNETFAVSAPITVDTTGPTLSFNAGSRGRGSVGSAQTTYFDLSYGDGSGSGLNSISLSAQQIVFNDHTDDGINDVAGCQATVSSISASVRRISITGCSADRGVVSVRVVAQTATDMVGNLAEASGNSLTFNVNNLGPNLSINTPVDNTQTSSSTVSVSGTCDASLPVNAFGGGLLSSQNTICDANDSFTMTLALTGSDGAKAFSVSSTNATAQTTTVTRTVMKDTVSPIVAIAGPTPSGPIKQSVSVVFNVYATDANTIVSFPESSITLLTQSGTPSCPSPVITGSGTVAVPYLVTVKNCSGNGSVKVSVAADAVTDASGNKSSLTVSTNAVTIDNTPPVAAALSLLNAAADQRINNSEKAGSAANLIGVSGTEGTVTYSIAANSGACQSASDYASSVPKSDDSRLVNGNSVVICVKDTDSANNSTITVSSPIQIDTSIPSAPTVAVPALSGNQLINISENASGFSVDISGENGSGYLLNCTNNCKIFEGASLSSARTGMLDSGTANVFVKVDSDGAFAFSVTQTDAAGNTSSAATVAGTADLTAPANPTVTISVLDGGGRISSSENISGFPVLISGEAGTSFAITGNNYGVSAGSGLLTTGSTSVTANAIAEGGFLFSVTLTDAAGNTSSTTLNGIADFTPPKNLFLTRINVAADGYLNAMDVSDANTKLQAVVSFSGDGSDFEMYAIAGSTTTCNDLLAYSSQVPTAEDVGGNGVSNYISKKICVKSIDLAGNTAFASSPLIYIDKLAPTITFSSPSRSAVSSALSLTYTVTYADSGGRGFSSISLSASDVVLAGDTAGCTKGVTDSGNNTRTISIQGCSAPTARIGVSLQQGTATDAAGNVAGTATAGTLFDVINIPPVLTVTSPAENAKRNGSAFNITGDCEAGLSVVAQGAITVTSSMVVCSGSNNYSLPITLSSGDGSKVVSITSTGRSNLTTTVNRTFIRDVVAPAVTISAPSVTTVRAGTSTVYTLTFSADTVQFDTSKVTLTPSGGVSCAMTLAGTMTSQTVTLTNCTGDGTVGLSVASGAVSDGANNSSTAVTTSAGQLVTVDNTVNVTLIPDSLIALRKSHQFRWTADEAITSYRCSWDNGVNFASCSSPVSNTALSNGTSYTFVLEAIDVVGNVQTFNHTWTPQAYNAVMLWSFDSSVASRASYNTATYPNTWSSTSAPAYDTGANKLWIGSLKIDSDVRNFSINDNSTHALFLNRATIEYWIRPSGASLTTNEKLLSKGSIANNNYSWGLEAVMAGGNTNNFSLIFKASSDGTGTNMFSAQTSGTCFVKGSYTHIAVTFNEGTVAIYCGGKLAAITTSGTSPTRLYQSTGSLMMGDTVQTTKGFVDELRISQMVRYTSDFTVPSAAFTAD